MAFSCPDPYASVRKEHGNVVIEQQLAGRSTERPLTQTRMPVAAGHDHARADAACMGKDGRPRSDLSQRADGGNGDRYGCEVSNTPSSVSERTSWIDALHTDAVPHESLEISAISSASA